MHQKSFIADTHTHFYSARFASAPTALMTPPDAWVDVEAVRNRILTENPAELYGF